MHFSFTLIILKLKLRYKTDYGTENRILLEQSINKDSWIYLGLLLDNLSKISYLHT